MCPGQLLCYVATTYGNKTAASVEAEIVAYITVRNVHNRFVCVVLTPVVAFTVSGCDRWSAL